MRRLLVTLAAAAAVLAVAPAASAAWCGPDQTAVDRPDAVTGAQLHVIYAYPSDGGNAFPAMANELQADAETVDAWWRGQDPARAPRFDLAAFPACTALDLGVVQLGMTAAQLSPSGRRFQTIFGLLPRFNQWKKVVVYYDGPIDDASVCGTGGGSQGTGSDSLAIVYMRSSCARTQSLRAAVLAHEVTHELGAPDGKEPHPYPGDTGHVGDTDRDLMYPYLSVGTIDELVLDVGRDDYYRNGGSTFDLSTSAWLRHLEAPQQPLTVAVTGGEGTITSDLPGVSCTGSCTSQWDAAAKVTLVAQPGAGQRFVRWTGGCSGNGACLVTLNGPTAVAAVFGPGATKVTAAVSGKGRIVGVGIACPSACSTQPDIATPVRLTAQPAKGWRFAGWSGVCHGTKPVCRFTAATATAAVRARFVRG